MALSYAHGAVTWLAADAATTTYAVTGLGFVPTALRFSSSGITSATDASSTSLNVRHSVGFAASTTDRRCVGSTDVDNAADTTCTAGVRDDAVVAVFTATGPAVDGLLDLASIDADGFTLVVDDQIAANLIVFWEAWGGTDILSARTLEIAEPAATGQVTYTATNLIAVNPEKQVVMFAGCQQTGATPSVGRAGSAICVGAATSATDAITISAGDVDAQPSGTTNRYNQTGECISMQAVASGNDNPTARAAFVAFTSGGFTLNWLARTTTGRKYIAMAIRGGSWKASSGVIARQTLNATMAVSGLSFQPKGLEMVFSGLGVLTAGTGGSGCFLGYGSAASTSSRRCYSIYHEAGATTTDPELAVEYDQLGILFFAGATDSLYDLSAIAADGFTLIVDDASAFSLNQWMGYLAFGDGVSAADPVSADGSPLRIRLHRKALGF